MIATTLLAVLCLLLLVVATLLYVYAQGCKADYEEAIEDVEYYYQLAGKYAAEVDDLQEVLRVRSY